MLTDLFLCARVFREGKKDCSVSERERGKENVTRFSMNISMHDEEMRVAFAREVLTNEREYASAIQM